MKFMKKVLTTALFFIAALNASAFNIGVAPTGFYTSLDKNETHEIMVSNNTINSVKIEVVAEGAEGWENHDMSQWIKIYPKNLVLKPNGSRSIRFSIQKPKDIVEGEYKTRLVFKELPGSETENEEVVDSSTEAKVSFELLTEINIEAYGLKGKRDAQGEFLGHKIEKNANGDKTLVTMIKPKGNSSLSMRGDVEFVDANKKILEKREIKLGRTKGVGESELRTLLSEIPENSKSIRITYREKDGIKLGSSELPL